jgi:N-acetylglucosamine malate deacetylase 1
MNIVCIGAHPDDGEYHAGGTLLKWHRAGARVLVVSLTNGALGHYAMSGEPLAERRAAESRRAAAVSGYEPLVLETPDGELLPTLELRKEVVRILRMARADVVLTHRPWDYHPDHRYTAAVVQDAAFMVTVPHYCPETPRLEKNPVFLYMMDFFQKPLPFRPDVAVTVDDVMEEKWALLDAMESQTYEWLPWLEGCAEEVPEDREERKRWLKSRWSGLFEKYTHEFQSYLQAQYGSQSDAIRFAEFFEVCEYGHQPSPAALRALFPLED